MKKSEKISWAIAGLLLIALLVEIFARKTPTIPENPYAEVRTDTIFVGRDYSKQFNRLQKQIDDLKSTPPTQVIYYKPEKTPPAVITQERIPDSLILYIADLKERLAISESFITQYPKASKLISGSLTRNNFKLALLQTDGLVKEQEFDIYLDGYNYYWSNNELRHEKRKRPYKYKDPARWKQLYLNFGRDFLEKQNILSLDYQLLLNRIRIRSELDLILQKNTTLRNKVTLGYRLFK